MTTTLTKSNGQHAALPSVERAFAMLAEARSTNEVKKIRAIAQAVATLERGKDIGFDAGEIILQADARIGELTREMQKGQAKPGSRAEPGSAPKRVALKSEGISKKLAAECERIAALSDSGDLKRYTAACRKAKKMPTSKGAVALTRLDPTERAEAIAQIEEPTSKANGQSTREPTEWDRQKYMDDISRQIHAWFVTWREHEPHCTTLKVLITSSTSLEEKIDGTARRSVR